MRRALSGPGTEHAVRDGDRHTVCGYPIVQEITMARVARVVPGEYTGVAPSCRRCAERLEAAETAVRQRKVSWCLPSGA